MYSPRDSIRRLFCCFVPSYIQSRYDGSNKPATKLHATAALDGLRGIAALLVFSFHIAFSFARFHEFGYGVDGGQKYFVQLPVIRLFFSGHAMVPIFFIVGGYVMSIKPLKQIHAGQKAPFLDSLVSSVFRRAIRLYAPALIATFISMLTLYFGLWEYQRQYAPFIPNADHHIPRFTTFWAHILDWLNETKGLTNLFGYYHHGLIFPYYPHYDPHLWTVPVEYRSGLLLALSLLAFSRCKTAARMTLMFSTILFLIFWDRWELVCFFTGSLLCEYDIITNTFCTEANRPTPNLDAEAEKADPSSTEPLLPIYDESSSSSSSSSSRSSSSWNPWSRPTQPSSSWFPWRRASAPTRGQQPRTKLHILLFLTGLYFLSAPPMRLEQTPLYAWQRHVIPRTYSDPKRFPYTIGALLIIYVLTHSPVLRKPFETSFAQYLGRISYSLYIVHGPLIHVVGFAVIPWVMKNVTGTASNNTWALGLFLGSTVLAGVVAVVADWFWRVVEVPSVDWARRFEKLCFLTESR